MNWPALNRYFCYAHLYRSFTSNFMINCISLLVKAQLPNFQVSSHSNTYNLLAEIKAFFLSYFLLRCLQLWFLISHIFILLSSKKDIESCSGNKFLEYLTQKCNFLKLFQKKFLFWTYFCINYSEATERAVKQSYKIFYICSLLKIFLL